MKDGEKIQVWGTYLTERKERLLSRHESIEEAEAEKSRLEKLGVDFWDRRQPLYRDITIKAPDEAIAALIHSCIAAARKP